MITHLLMELLLVEQIQDFYLLKLAMLVLGQQVLIGLVMAIQF